jgi:putative flippase GtrA
MSSLNIAVKYSSFAVFATLANLFAQELSVRFYNGEFSIYVGILLGTLAGLLCKYYLDKRFIFVYRASSSVDDLRKFLSYSLTGVGTTLLFWTTEISFEFLYGTKTARYFGAVIGLTIGYVVKYHLDKHYVFSKREG